MKSSALLKAGTIGVIVSALCCFTPALVFLLGVVGLSAWAGYIDYVLMPALLFFAGLIIYAVTMPSNVARTESCGSQTPKT